MAKTDTALDRARASLQDLHKHISSQVQDLDQATHKDVKSTSEKAAEIATSLKASAADQGDKVKTFIQAAVAKLELAGKQAQESAGATKDQLKKDNLSLLSKVRGALQDMTKAVATARHHAIGVKS